MKEITEAFGSEAERKLSSPSSAKWPRIDSGDLSVNSRPNSPLTPVDLQKSGGHTWASEFEDFHTKPCDETLTVAYALHTSAAHSIGSHPESSQVSFIISEGHQAPVWRTEHPLLPNTDEFKFSPRDYSGVPPTSANTYSSSSPVYKQQRKSLESGSPGSCSFLSGSDEEGTQVQTSIGQTLAVALSSARFDCADDAVCVRGLCETRSQFAEVEEGNPECDFSKNILSPAVVSNPEEVVLGNLKEGEGKDKKWEIWIGKSADVFNCGADTKVHENGMRETIICSPAKRVEGSILLDAMGEKTVYPEVNNHGEAFSATNPAIRVETVNKFEWMHSYSASTADRLCFHSKNLQKVQESPDQSEQNNAWLCKEASEASCQSIAQTQAGFVTIYSSLCMNGKEGNCQPHSSPSVTPCGTQRGHQPEDLSEAEYKTEEILHYLKDKKAVSSMEKLLSPGQQNQCFTNQRETVKGEGELERNVKLLCPQPASSDVYVMDMSKEKEVVIDATEEIKAVGCEHSEMWTNNSVHQLAASRTSVCDANKQKQMLHFCCDRQHRSQAASAEDGDQILGLTVPSASDAVVPCQLDLSSSQNKHQSSTALPHHDRCALLSLSVCSRVLGAFDTFERIHLSSDDDDTCLSCIPPQPLKATSPLLPYMLVEESGCPEDSPLENFSEEKVERIQINPENSVKRSDCNSFIHNETPQIISVPKRPKLQPDGGSVCESSQSKTLPTESDSPSCCNTSSCTEFDMAEQFSKVLKELNLFFDISSNDFTQSPSPDHYCTDPLERSTLEPTQYLKNPEPDNFRATSTGSSESPRRLEPLKTCTRPIRVGLSKRAKTKHLHRSHPY
ncbi:RAD51-associated protein 2 isoform X3 [Oryzias latipes]|uniref:RAD51-associated protein 2 isoform X3 n=1 Tax=Oryzias latipes TaxID=8090 RepID=UPI000CE1FBA4|nr:RAD51-associated protein 2 isoform X3 [Oryzias latipes]